MSVRLRPFSRRFARHLTRHQGGATLIEFTLVFMILLSVTFGIFELGLAMLRFNGGTKAVFDGVRTAVQSDPAASDLTTWDAISEASFRPGQDLSTLASFTVRCVNGGCTCASGACPTGTTYDDTAFQAIVDAMRPHLAALPLDSDPSELAYVDYTHVGLGFAGRPGADVVPLVTVGLTGIVHRFVVMGVFGLSEIVLPDARATMPGEDMESDGAV